MSLLPAHYVTAVLALPAIAGPLHVGVFALHELEFDHGQAGIGLDKEPGLMLVSEDTETDPVVWDPQPICEVSRRDEVQELAHARESTSRVRRYLLAGFLFAAQIAIEPATARPRIASGTALEPTAWTCFVCSVAVTLTCSVCSCATNF